MVRLLHKIFVVIIFCPLLFGAKAADALPNITAKAWLVADDNGNVLEGINTKDVRSIASISKLMTAMVVLDAKQDLDEKILLRKIPTTRLELIQLAVTHSDNEASVKLCETYIHGYYSCIRAMNEKAEELNMPNTKFIEPTGLSIFNVSTAEELIKLVYSASKYPEIVQASKSQIVKVKVVTKSKTFWQEFRNTNPLVATKNFIVSKTGFINKSGGCIVMMLETTKGIRTVVLLGSKDTKTRIPEASLISSLY